MTDQSNGAVTRDGCAVEVYRRLPAGDDVRLIHSSISPSASILDLGAGVGRLADPLVRLGHRVVAVDDSVEMLSHVSRAEAVRSSIESLRLAERFDLVLMASHLINATDADTRRQLLQAVAFHLAEDGRALLQWHEPEWFDSLRAGQVLRGTIGDLATELDVQSVRAGRLTATVRYRVDGRTWSQTFSAARLTIAQIVDDLEQAGLELDEAPRSRPGWLYLRRRNSQTGPSAHPDRRPR